MPEGQPTTLLSARVVVIVVSPGECRP